MDLDKQIEAILFYKAEPVERKWLSKTLDKSMDEINDALQSLRRNLEGRGVVLIETEHELSIGTHPGLASLIERMRTEELEGELGKAALETLGIILYKGPITKAGVEYIRGVNSQFTIRHLLMRGMIERRDNPRDARSNLYAVTIKLLAHLGAESAESLPDREGIVARLSEIENASAKKDEEDTTI